MNSIYRAWRQFTLWLFNATRPWTSTYLAASPASPMLLVTDVRSERIRIRYEVEKTSRFNLDEYQLAFSRCDDSHSEEEWSEDKWTPNASRVLPSLTPDSTYKIRARCRNVKGVSDWSPSVSVQTLQSPQNGGGTCDAYTWTQTAAEVSVQYTLPSTVASKHINVAVTPTRLCASFRSGSSTTVLAHAELPHRVRSLTPEGGSFWELDRQPDRVVLVISLEKEVTATSTKWGFWRCMFVGEHEIDTHAIEEDPSLKKRQKGQAVTRAQAELEELRERVRSVKTSETARILKELDAHANRLQ